jgi:16S rRNA U1498 N3-methylase RsmE
MARMRSVERAERVEMAESVEEAVLEARHQSQRPRMKKVRKMKSLTRKLELSLYQME